MNKDYKTIKEATKEWMTEFSAIPRGMIRDLMCYDEEKWSEVTAPAKDDRVYVHNIPGDENCGVIIGYDQESKLYCVELDDGTEVSVSEADLVVDYESLLPMNETMWAFGDSSDDYWLSELGGIRQMSMCGFRIYEHEDYGYFFGIDGCGSNFMEERWVPLYKARGLQWHDPEAEAVEYMVKCGRKNTFSGNYHFDFDEIEKVTGVRVDDEFKKKVAEIAMEKYGYMIADLTIEDDFDFIFYTCFCPNAEQEAS